MGLCGCWGSISRVASFATIAHGRCVADRRRKGTRGRWDPPFRPGARSSPLTWASVSPTPYDRYVSQVCQISRLARSLRFRPQWCNPDPDGGGSQPRLEPSSCPSQPRKYGKGGEGGRRRNGQGERSERKCVCVCLVCRNDMLRVTGHAGLGWGWATGQGTRSSPCPEMPRESRRGDSWLVAESKCQETRSRGSKHQDLLRPPYGGGRRPVSQPMWTPWSAWLQRGFRGGGSGRTPALAGAVAEVVAALVVVLVVLVLRRDDRVPTGAGPSVQSYRLLTLEAVEVFVSHGAHG